jgi:UDP-N-acetyl-D-glucosamine dehydrogenase
VADLAVVGLGYVGLPLARAAARAGLEVVGFDVSTAVSTCSTDAGCSVGRAVVSGLALSRQLA